MKRIALTLATLALSGGVALAAAPTTSAPASHSSMPAAATQRHHAMHAAMSGSHEAERMTSALNLLEAKGYGSFTNFKPDGKDFTATVLKNGQSQTLRIDPDTGSITNQS